MKCALILATGVFLYAGEKIAIADTLHSFCVSPTPTCAAHDGITSTDTNPPKFGFLSSGTQQGNLELMLLAPNNEDVTPGSFSMTIDGVNVADAFASSSLVSTTPWAASKAKPNPQLKDYLGVSYAMSNPLHSFLPYTQEVDAGATGYYVYTFSFGAETGSPKNTATAPE